MELGPEIFNKDSPTLYFCASFLSRCQRIFMLIDFTMLK